MSSTNKATFIKKVVKLPLQPASMKVVKLPIDPLKAPAHAKLKKALKQNEQYNKTKPIPKFTGVEDILTHWEERQEEYPVECKTVGPNKITVCEPYTYVSSEPTINVTDEFYEVLKQPPISLNDGFCNAYIFGEIFPASEYKYVSGHGNDGAQTGIVNITDITEEESNNIVSNNVWVELNVQWDAAENIPILREHLPRVLFLGETVGGDVGATVYIHTTNDVVDSLIINNNYCFRG